MTLLAAQDHSEPYAFADGTAVRSGSAVALSVEGVSVAYEGRLVVEDVSFTVPHGARLAVIGPNGAGKSSLLKAVVGLVSRRAGRIEVLGRPIEQARGLVGWVPQRSSVDWGFPVTALEVVSMGRYRSIGWLRPVRRRDRDAALEALDLVGMADFADRQIGRLSGGQQQRVFLARALAQQAEIYLLDEPLAGVDAVSERAIVEVMEDLAREGRAVIAVHHDLDTAGSYFDSALILNRKLIACGPVAEVLDETNLAAAYGGRLARLRAAGAG